MHQYRFGLIVGVVSDSDRTGASRFRHATEKTVPGPTRRLLNSEMVRPGKSRNI
jgi:hypothetical protein